jgi:hypothetical protein
VISKLVTVGISTSGRAQYLEVKIFVSFEYDLKIETLYYTRHQMVKRLSLLRAIKNKPKFKFAAHRQQR